MRTPRKLSFRGQNPENRNSRAPGGWHPARRSRLIGPRLTRAAGSGGDPPFHIFANLPRVEHGAITGASRNGTKRCTEPRLSRLVRPQLSLRALAHHQEHRKEYPHRAWRDQFQHRQHDTPSPRTLSPTKPIARAWAVVCAADHIEKA